MHNLTPPYPIWSAWPYLSAYEHLFLLALGALTVYFLYATVVTISRCRECRAKSHKGDGGADIQRMVAALRMRCMRLRRLNEAGVCLFGVVFFWGLLLAYYTIGATESTPVGYLVLLNFHVHLIFALNVSFLFLVLHLLGWFMVNRVDACAQVPS
jgi:hypothetical protein